MIMIIDFFQDALFASIAAIGFASISNPPRKAYRYCALIAAVGHSIRFLLMLSGGVEMHIVAATALASFVTGMVAVLFSTRAKMPAETFLFPSLLPMIPGIYAYKTFGGLVMCLYGSNEAEFLNALYLFADNGLTCLFILLGLVIGANSPIFLLKKISFRATRRSFHRKL